MSVPTVEISDYHNSANFMILEGISSTSREELERGIAGFEHELNFVVTVSNYQIVDVAIVNGYHESKADEVRELVKALLDNVLFGDAVILVSFGEVYLLNGSYLLNELGYKLSGIKTGTINTVLPGKLQQPWSYSFIMLYSH
jgi:hypothetical protein